MGLGLRWDVFLTQLVNFAILLLLLRMFLYQPILKMLEDRSRRAAETVEREQQVRAELERTRADYQAEMQRARQEAQAIIGQASEAGERLRAELREQAEAEAEAYRERARVEIRQETEKAVATLRQEVADLAVLAAGRIIRRNLDPATQRDLIEDVIQSADKLRLE
jgi:F-type H+-transporting ATPase subunit b